MKQLNTDCQVNIYLSSEDKALLMIQSKRANMSTSRYVRMLIDCAIRPLKDSLIKGEITYADLETILDHKLQYKTLFKK